MSERSMLPLAMTVGCGTSLLGLIVAGAVVFASGMYADPGLAIFYKETPKLTVEAQLLTSSNAVEVEMSRFLSFGTHLPDAGLDPNQLVELPDRDVERLMAWTPDSEDDSVIDKLLLQGLAGYAVVEITHREIRVSGQPVLSLEDGLIPEDERRRMSVTKLYDRLLELAEAQKVVGERSGTMEFSGEILLFINPDTPTVTVEQVMYTSGQAQFGTFFLAVDGGDGAGVYTGRGAYTPNVDGHKMTAVQDDGKVSVFLPTGIEQSGPAADAAHLVDAAVSETAPSCAVYVREAVPTFADALPTLDALFAPSVQWMVWSRGDAVLQKGTEQPPLGSPSSLGLRDTVTAVPVSLPWIGPPRGEPVTNASCRTSAPHPHAEPDAPAVIPEPVSSSPSRGRFGQKGPGGIGQIDGDPIIIGSLDRSLVDAVVKRHMNQIRYCYQRELTKDPTLAGKIVVKFVVATDGSVSQAATKSSTMDSSSVEGCVSQRFMRFKFPEPKDGGIVIVSYPFAFAPG